LSSSTRLVLYNSRVHLYDIISTSSVFPGWDLYQAQYEVRHTKLFQPVSKHRRARRDAPSWRVAWLSVANWLRYVRRRTSSRSSPAPEISPTSTTQPSGVRFLPQTPPPTRGIVADRAQRPARPSQRALKRKSRKTRFPVPRS
jgi:hypothetical protein